MRLVTVLGPYAPRIWCAVIPAQGAVEWRHGPLAKNDVLMDCLTGKLLGLNLLRMRDGAWERTEGGAEEGVKMP